MHDIEMLLFFMMVSFQIYLNLYASQNVYTIPLEIHSFEKQRVAIHIGIQAWYLDTMPLEITSLMHLDFLT